MKSLSLYFSPTGGGEKIAKAIQNGIDQNDYDYQFSLNLNKRPVSAETGEIETLPVIFTIPVYGGQMPKVAMERLNTLRSECNQPAILVAVYGNRAFEKALIDLEAFVRERGFNPIAAGAFPCEHSYSTDETPIAAGRPDNTDLKMAEEFGRLVREKILRNDFSSVNTSDLQDEPSPEASLKNFITFVKAYQTQQSTEPKIYIPLIDTEKCTECGECSDACPTAAIREDFTTDATRCIKCCACVKICPAQARGFHTPFARPLSENFSERKSPCWIL